jgi:iron complex outermembrane recepter protein
MPAANSYLSMTGRDWRKPGVQSSYLLTPNDGVAAEGEARPFWFLIVAVLCFATLLPVVSVGSAADDSRVVRFDIARQSADQALIAFAEQAEVTFIFPQYKARKVMANEVRGEFTPQQAIEKLLDGTGLHCRLQSNGAWTVSANNGSSEQEEPVKKRGLLAGILAALVVNPVGYANADQATEPETAPAKLSEVLVTAQKRTERLQDVPISIAAVDSEGIDRRRLIGASDYLRGLPGVNQTEVGYGGQAIIIRGLETTNTFLNFSGGTTVGTYFGETPTTNSAGLLGSSVDIKLVDVDRVEVLRGPQGTSFGSSSMGGTVRIIPTTPQLDRFEGKVGAGYSQTSGTGGDNYDIQGVANVPLIDGKLAVRAVAYKYSDSGYYRNRAGSDPAFQSSYVVPFGIQDFAVDKEEVGAYYSAGVRAAVLFQATDDFRLTLNYLTQDSETDGFPIANSDTYEQTLTQVAPEHVIRGQTGGVGDSSIELFSLLAEYDFGWADLAASYSQLEGDSNHALVAALFAGFMVPVSFGQFSPHEEYSGEIRLATKLEGSWDFLFGLYTEDQEDEYFSDWIWFGDPATNFFVPPDRDLFDYVDRRDLKQDAAFAEVSWEFVPRITLTGGIRAYDYERRTRIDQSGAGVGGAVISTDESSDDSGTTYRANVSYKPSDDALLYASWTEGFRLGRPQSPIPSGACDVDGNGLIDGTDIPIDSTGSVDSDTVESYEVGGKFTFLDQRISLDAAIYHMEWTDIPVQILPPCGFAYTTNAGVGESEGIEFQANFQVTDAFLVNLGASRINAELTEDVPAQGFSAGDPLPGTPETTANLALQYSFDIGNNPTYLRADTIYVDSFFGDIAQSPNQKAGDYVKVNASARVTIRNLSIDLYVHNATDEDAFASRGVGGNDFYGYRLRPRTIGLQLIYDF